jgi:hypothetical protein
MSKVKIVDCAHLAPNLERPRGIKPRAYPNGADHGHRTAAVTRHRKLEFLEIHLEVSSGHKPLILWICWIARDHIALFRRAIFPIRR